MQCIDRRSTLEVFLGKGVLKICSKFTGEHPCQSVISVKLLWNFTKITLCHGCSLVNLPHIFRTPLEGCFCIELISMEVCLTLFPEVLFPNRSYGLTYGENANLSYLRFADVISQSHWMWWNNSYFFDCHLSNIPVCWLRSCSWSSTWLFSVRAENYVSHIRFPMMHK